MWVCAHVHGRRVQFGYRVGGGGGLRTVSPAPDTLLATLLSLALAALVTSFLKRNVGRPRPNFYALLALDPKEYAGTAYRSFLDALTFFEKAGERPEPQDNVEHEPGESRHGWQFYASHGLITYHREHAVLPNLDEKARARVRSQSGAHAGAWLYAIPSEPGTTLDPARCMVALRRRLRLGLPAPAL